MLRDKIAAQERHLSILHGRKRLAIVKQDAKAVVGLDHQISEAERELKKLLTAEAATAAHAKPTEEVEEIMGRFHKAMRDAQAAFDAVAVVGRELLAYFAHAYSQERSALAFLDMANIPADQIPREHDEPQA